MLQSGDHLLIPAVNVTYGQLVSGRIPSFTFSEETKAPRVAAFHKQL